MRAIGRLAESMLLLLALAEPGAAAAGRTFSTEIACAKDKALGASTCKRAFVVARAAYETMTRSYSSRFACYRAYGPCMPWPPNVGLAARFRPQLMGVAVMGSLPDGTAMPVVASGRIKLALSPQALTGVVAAATAVAEPPPGPRYPGAASALCRQIEAVAARENLPPAVFARLLWQESSFRASVVSPAGAAGIAQFMPETARDRGLADPFDTDRAIQTSAAFLRDLTRRFGNIGLAAAAYNGGPARVSGWLQGRRTLAAETHAYVRRITGRTVEDWAARSEPDVPSSPLPASCFELMRQTP